MAEIESSCLTKYEIQLPAGKRPNIKKISGTGPSAKQPLATLAPPLRSQSLPLAENPPEVSIEAACNLWLNSARKQQT